MAWFPGTEGGNALADVLFGDANPSAKLPVTWPRTIGQVPLIYARLPTGRRPDPKNPLHAALRRRGGDPAVPVRIRAFLHGFRGLDLHVEAPRLSRQGALVVSARVANLGARTGREVAQLYIRQPVASISRPVRELKAFEKVELAPGESRTVTFRIPVRRTRVPPRGRVRRGRTRPVPGLCRIVVRRDVIGGASRWWSRSAPLRDRLTASGPSGDLDLQPKDQEAPRLAVRIEVQRRVDPALQPAERITRLRPCRWSRS